MNTVTLDCGCEAPMTHHSGDRRFVCPGRYPNPQVEGDTGCSGGLVWVVTASRPVVYTARRFDKAVSA